MPPPRRNRNAYRLLDVFVTSNPEDFAALVQKYPERYHIIAEGDSWFRYPFGNIINALKEKKIFNILQLASNGDEAIAMLSGDAKHKLIEHLSRFNADFLLFSGGGNDIVGKYDFDFFLQNIQGNISEHWQEYVYMNRVKRRLRQISDAYSELIELTNTYAANENIKIVTHTYDYPTPRDVSTELLGIELAGPWLFPYLVDEQLGRDIPLDIASHIVKALIEELKVMLLDLQQQYPNRLIVADTTNTLRPNNDEDWRDEIHPTEHGFKQIAEKIYQAMQPHFPDRT